MSEKRRKGYRRLEINGRLWQWKIGKIAVNIVDPEGNSTQVSNADITVTLPTVCECCHMHDGGTAQVALPGRIARYIRHRLDVAV